MTTYPRRPRRRVLFSQLCLLFVFDVDFSKDRFLFEGEKGRDWDIGLGMRGRRTVSQK